MTFDTDEEVEERHSSHIIQMRTAAGDWLATEHGTDVTGRGETRQAAVAEYATRQEARMHGHAPEPAEEVADD